MSFVSINGALIPEAEATVSVKERGFRFGDGVFETIALYNGKPYQWDWHMQRMREGLEAIYIPYKFDQLASWCKALVKKNGHGHGALRMYISRGQGGRGYLPPEEPMPLTVIETMPKPPMKDNHHIALWLSSYQKISPSALPIQCKTAQGLQSTLVRREAAANRCADGLMLNASGHICETGSSNIFWLHNDQLHTPSLSCGVLNGSTRAALMRISPIPITEGDYTLADIKQAHAVVMSNVILGVKPVFALKPEGCTWDSADLATQLQQALDEDIHTQLTNYNWS